MLKLFPRDKDPITGKKDFQGNIVTTKDSFINLYSQEFTQRLQNRKIETKYSYLKNIKELLWKYRLEECKNKKTSDWDIGDLDKVTKSLKTINLMIL